MNNKLITKPGKIIRKDQLPEVDLGPVTNVKALKESRIEIFSDTDKANKSLTRKIFLSLTPADQRNFPVCDSECRSPMESLIFSKKFANDIIRCLLLGNKLDTGIKVKAALSAYTGEIMNQQNIEDKMKMSNPKSNLLLNDRCTLLRMKIRFKIFHTKLDLYRMKIEGYMTQIVRTA